MLKEATPRQGFFEHDQYLSLLKALPFHLRPVVIFAYHTGWRKNEILNLQWTQIDLNERYIHLTPDQTKNSEARSIYIGDELYKMLKIQKLKTFKGCLYVFHKKGEKIGDFRKVWKKACKKAGVEGRLFHDFRRTAARNLTRSGTQETVAMKITGHRTRSVFDRYNITSQDDIRKAVERQDSYLSQSVTKTVTIDENQQGGKKRSKAQVVNFKR
jgi:integrase